MSHLIEMSNITTRANNQFPRPDFHRLDKQPYRLQPFSKGEYLATTGSDNSFTVPLSKEVYSPTARLTG